MIAQEKKIPCDCGEEVLLRLGHKMYLNPTARAQYPSQAESEATVVGWSSAWDYMIRVLFEGNKTKTSMSIGWFHQSPRHREWEKEQGDGTSQ